MLFSCFSLRIRVITTQALRPWTPTTTTQTFDPRSAHRTPTTTPQTFDPRSAHRTLFFFTIWTFLLWNMAGSVRSCCVPKCGKSRADNVILHAFPDPTTEKDRFITWVNAVGSSVSALDPQFIYKNRKICHYHFEKRYLTWTRRLAYGAVPTLGMPGFNVLRDATNIDFERKHVDTSGGASTSTAPLPLKRKSEFVSAKSSLKECHIMAGTTNVSDVSRKHAVISGIPHMIPLEKSDEKPVPDVDTIEKPVLRPAAVEKCCKDTKYIDDKNALALMLKKALKKKENYSSRLKKALKLSENVTFQNVLKKFTQMAAIFMTLQFREISKDKMGRRFTEEEKIMALSLYKQGPRCYRLLRKAFVLPSPLTLSRLIAKANLRAGINEKLFNVLKKKVKKMKGDDNLCILLFDEMALSPHFDYNLRKDTISGFVDNGKLKENKIADHALVFMIRGITRNYKQPVEYTFCSGSTKKEELAMLLKDIIRKLHSVGLRVLATVCDQGASNVSCINYLINDTKTKYLKENKEHRRNVFEVDGEEIIPLYDPPHLIKGIRNNFMAKDLKCTIDGVPKLAKWEHLKKLYEEDPAYSGIRLLKKLTENHINPEKCKMKVKYATQALSQRVASTMGYLAEKDILPKECQDTADVILFFDQLFDSLNGSYENSKKRSGKPLLSALTPKSQHSTVWSKAKIVLNSMSFLVKHKESKVPTLINFLQTINNAEYLRDVLFQKYNIKSIWMRHFNQDPLENFFGAIRSHGCRNINPSPQGFEMAFASLLLNNLTGAHSPGSNCEKDTCKNMFKSMRELFKNPQKSNQSHEIDLSYLDQNIFLPFEIKCQNPKRKAHIQYLTGYLLKKTKTHVFKNCTVCKNSFYNKNKECDYLKSREYYKKNQKLHYPNEDAMKMFSTIQDVLVWVTKNHSKSDNIKLYAKTILCIELDINFINCVEHKEKNVNFILDLACRFFIFNWCKDVNNILMARRRGDEEVVDDQIKRLAVDYVKKRMKKK